MFHDTNIHNIHNMYTQIALSFLLFLLAYLLYESPESPESMTKTTENTGYSVSMITLWNPANAPFYYHTSLELKKEDELWSYGFYPDNRQTIWLFRLLRPILPVSGRIRTPDPLYAGDSLKNISRGQVLYREDYAVS